MNLLTYKEVEILVTGNKKVDIELLKLNTALCRQSFEDKLNENE